MSILSNNDIPKEPMTRSKVDVEAHQCVHLTTLERNERWGPPKRKGVLVVDNRIQCVKVVLGVSRKYINHISHDGTWIWYCKSPDAIAHAIMVSMTGRTDLMMDVHVVQNCDDYWYGKYSVRYWDAETRTYILKRVHVPLDTKIDGSLRDDSTMVVSSSPCKRKRTQCMPRQVKLDGHLYDSVLEAQHAVFFNTLGIRHQPHPGAFTLPSGTYNVDAYLPHINMWIEIKCRHPYDSEMIRCQEVAETYGLCVAILYGTMQSPYGMKRPKGPIAPYTHHNGIRALVWPPGGTPMSCGCWIWDGDTYQIDARLDVTDRRWCAGNLDAAYATAASWTGEYS
jgi:hypothetical protein